MILVKGTSRRYQLVYDKEKARISLNLQGLDISREKSKPKVKMGFCVLTYPLLNIILVVNDFDLSFIK